MSLLDNLFSKKSATSAASAREGGRDQDDAYPTSHLAAGNHSADRKSLRMERRELLYAVVRESMTRVGMLSASYKYKVLSLDPRGRQYMIMMDLPQGLEVDTAGLAEIESVIAQNAKARHDIVVTAVYWRINEPLTAATPRKAKPSRTGDPTQSVHADESSTAKPSTGEQAPTARQTGRFEPIQQDEVAAFNQALSEGLGTEAPMPKEKLIKSWKHKPIPRADFADTELQEPGEKAKQPPRQNTRRPPDFQDTEVADKGQKTSPLSSTQYGDLN